MREGDPIPTRTTETIDQSRVALGGLFLALVLMALGPSILRQAETGGVAFASWRMLGGAAAYSALLYVRRGRLSSAAFRASALGGVLFGGEIALGYTALTETSVTNAVLIFSLRPALVLVVVGPLFGERVRPAAVGWTLLAIGGTAVAVLGAGDTAGRTLHGDLAAIAAMAVSTAYLVASKTARGHSDALTYSAAMTTVAALFLLPASAAIEGGITTPPAGDLIWLAGMIALPGAGHVLTAHAHPHVPLALLSSVFLLLPGVTALLSWVLIDESIAAAHVIGIAITTAALAMVVLRNERPPAAGDPEPPISGD